MIDKQQKHIKTNKIDQTTFSSKNLLSVYAFFRAYPRVYAVFRK